jgi:hypothetical protein
MWDGLEGSRSARMRAQAIAITGKVIRYVGDDRRVAAQIGPGTKVIDIKGRMLPSADLDFQGYQQLEKQGRLPVRVVVGSYYWNNPGIADPLPQQREKATSAAVTSKVRPAAGPCCSDPECPDRAGWGGETGSRRFRGRAGAPSP